MTYLIHFLVELLLGLVFALLGPLHQGGPLGRQVQAPLYLEVQHLRRGPDRVIGNECVTQEGVDVQRFQTAHGGGRH